ncbi:FKBP-type peptidyl-prolyl cis-trans isomerase fklB [gamma proteobacterium IMCC2047]|nr:FKBP-type peptidyl-prolyl cis-trans isomerase fklB [gamma proteobacterium IMCC2047]
MLRTISTVVLTSTLVLSGCYEAKEPQEKPGQLALDTDYQKLSYGLGLNIGSGIAQQGVPELDIDALVAGIRESVDGKDPRITQEELTAVISRVQKAEAEKQEQLATINQEKGKAFLEENGAREGVVTTASGLQYEILTAGEGDSPSADSIVNTHYHGTLIDGTVFDSSVERGEPIEFAVGQVIPGWTEALQLMKTGSKWRLYVPSELAYGEYSPGPNIPPHSTLIFDVELLGFKAPETADKNDNS